MDRSTLVTSLLFILTIYCGDFSKAQILNVNEKIKWVPFHQFNWQNHEDAGWEAPKERIFVARIQQGNGQLVGKFQVRYKAAHIIVDGKGVDVGQNAEVLQYPRGAVSWEPMKDVTHPPFNLIIGGIHPTTSEPIYICRAIDDNRGNHRISPGMFMFSRANDGCEINHHAIGTWNRDFEIMTLSYYGIAIMAATD